MPHGPGVTVYTALPAEGWSNDRVVEELEKLSSMEHARWEDGKVSGTVYNGKGELVKLQTEAYEKFAVSNPIHPDVFPGVRKMEAEIVAMVRLLSSCFRRRGIFHSLPEGFVHVQCSQRCSWCGDKWRDRIHPDGLFICT